MSATHTPQATTGWTLTQWQRAYRDEGHTPEALLAHFSGPHDTTDPAWICRADIALMTTQLEALARRLVEVGGDLKALPLYGVPFAVKDNIDTRGWPTTAACPAFSYLPQDDATVVARLRA
ncbi:MAG: allophanate hydrolase, partial [Alcaligenaceae bacterium]